MNLTLGLDYDVVENLLSHEQPWTTIPEEDLRESTNVIDPNFPTVLEIKLNQPVLKDGVQIFVIPDSGLFKFSFKNRIYFVKTIKNNFVINL